MNYHARAKELVARMTLEEKASLCSGKDFWLFKGIERLELPEIMVTDGPHGLRKEESADDNLGINRSIPDPDSPHRLKKEESTADQLGINRSIPATCFPTASATACSFDRELLFEIGKAIAEECRQENVAVLLGPGVNMKRSPLCGRNFEYFSEDPLLAGEMAAAFIEGVQSQDVGVSIKHFAANNQETRRMTIDAVMDERTFREIYLKAFEIAVKKARPWTVMCSYNKLFGEFASQNERLLTQILRDEWRFKGLVISDWGATVDRVSGLRAGLDLEMPHLDNRNDESILQAVRNGTLDEQVLNKGAERVTELILRSGKREPFIYDTDRHHALARRAAAQSAVLLKNEGDILPGKVTDKAAVIGAFAKITRYQGTGSSKIQPTRLDNAFDELHALGLTAEYAEGYRMDTDEVDEDLIQEACRAAEGKDIVYLLAGLPDRYEAESFDRESMSMPENHVRLIEAVSAVNQNLVVILMGGAPMELPWSDKARGILLMYLGGQAAGGACADLLLGKANPSGKLAETWPMSLADNPSYEYFPGYQVTVEYREGLFIGYRYYDSAGKDIRYPFGHGLSYTSFEYSDLRLSRREIMNSDPITITCKVRNTGAVAGAEVVQLYLSHKNPVIIRPEQELRGFEKVYLTPGQSREVSFQLNKQEFTFYNTALPGWDVENGEYEIRIGASSRNIRLRETVGVTHTNGHPLPDMHELTPAYYSLSEGIRVPEKEFETLLGRPIPIRERAKGTRHSLNSTMADIQDKWFGKVLLRYFRSQIQKMPQDSEDTRLMAEKMIMDMPLRFLAMMGGDQISLTQVEGIVDLLNGRVFRGIKAFL